MTLLYHHFKSSIICIAPAYFYWRIKYFFIYCTGSSTSCTGTKRTRHFKCQTFNSTAETLLPTVSTARKQKRERKKWNTYARNCEWECRERAGRTQVFWGRCYGFSATSPPLLRYLQKCPKISASLFLSASPIKSALEPAGTPATERYAKRGQVRRNSVDSNSTGRRGTVNGTIVSKNIHPNRRRTRSQRNGT